MIGKEIDNSDEYWGRFGHGVNRFPTEAQVPGMRATMDEFVAFPSRLAPQLPWLT